MPLRNILSFLKISCLVMICLVENRRHLYCAESADCVGSATTAVGTRRYSVLQVYVLLRRVLKLDDQTLEHHVNQLTWTLPLRAPIEKVECASRTVEDGGRERVWSGCKPKPVSADQIQSTHATQNPRAHETASSIVYSG